MNYELKETPVLLLTGYLGSGKTTLVNHILANKRNIKFAVIVNDIGEVNIDASLIEKEGVVGKKDESLVALQNGCICCTLKMDLVQQLTDIMAMRRFDYIVIEASGICEPEPIAQTICSIPMMGAQFAQDGIARLDCITTVVDALRLQSEFGCGEELTRKNIDEEDLENLVIQQIEFCNIILLNKISEVTPDEAAHIRRILRAIQPKARIIECDYADVDLSLLLNTGLFDYEDVATSAAWVHEIEREMTEEEEDEAHGHHHHDDNDDDNDNDNLNDNDNDNDNDNHDDDDDDDEHEHEHHHHEHEHEHGHHHHHHHDGGEVEEYGISTFVYYRRPPFDINEFDQFVARKWPRNIIRAKGICYFSNNTDMSYLFEQAGVQKKIREAGLFWATAPEDELRDMMARDPQLLRDWDDTYGDRMIKLVFIGQNLDREWLTKELDACLR
ncbi:MAG: GTP-binding protein [Bacteroidaceae bacterium]|nr:GTP-binding protein [Bacteroidaceae bacterium]